MADVFISYAREDRSVAASLAQALQARGWTVWCDQYLQVGRPFSRVIESELASARAVIVLWSRASVESEWVAAEASEGNARAILVPVRLDEARPPLEFRRLHMASLAGWNGTPGHAALSDVFAAIERLVPARVAAPSSAPAAAAFAPAVRPGSSKGIAAVVIIAIALVSLWLAGYTLQIGGALVHLLLLAAIVIVIVRAVRLHSL